MTRKRILVGLAVFITALGGFVLYQLRGNPFDPLDRGKEVVAGEYLGKTKASIIQRYGPPSKEWAGHYGSPPTDYMEQHSPSVSLLYQRLTGTLYISLEKKDDDWICYSSHWMPNGAEF
jgi:hypothetical protein